MSETIPDAQTKVCPQCAEEVKAAARICRFCGYQFVRLDPGPTTALPDAQPAKAPVRSADVPVEQRRADLTVELAGATHEWTEPVVVRQFEASRAGQIVMGDAAGVMWEHGYEPESPVYDGVGAMNVTYTRRPDASLGTVPSTPPSASDAHEPTTKQYPLDAHPKYREADKAAMLRAGYVVWKEGHDGQGHYVVIYRRGPNWRPDVPTPASIPLPAEYVRRKARRPGNAVTATRVGEIIGQIILVGIVGVVIVLVVAFFATGGPKSPTSGTGGGTADGTQPPSDAGGAWPSGFKNGVCFGALFELQDAGSHLAALADAARNFDVARATDEAAAVNDRAQKAQAQLDALPAWAPAGALVADLRTAATSLRQGANLFQIAVKANDADGVKQAATYIASGTSAITSATSDVSSLRSQYGFSCQ